MSSRTLGLAFVVLLGVAEVALAAETVEIEPWLSMRTLDSAPETPVEMLHAVSPEQFDTAASDGHPFIEVATEFDVTIADDGIVTSRGAHIRQFVDESGIQTGGNLEIFVDTAVSTVQILRAYAVSPSGRPVAVDPSTIQVTNTDQPAVFSDRRRVVIPYPSLTPRSSAVLVWREDRRTDGDPLPWGINLYLRAAVPIVSTRISVEADSPGRFAWSTDSPDLKCPVQTDRRLSCELGWTDAIAIDPNVRSYYDLVPQLVIATPDTWSGLAAATAQLVHEKATVGGEVATTAERLTADARTPTERVDALYRFVTDEIRYVAFEHGAGGHVPRPAELTLARRYGDCKDKVTLFVALARVAGMEAWPVLTSSFQFDPDRLLIPNASYFDHMVTCVLLEGEPLCLDVTVPHGGLELPRLLHGAVALDLVEGVSALRSFDASDHIWEIEVDTTTHVGCDGSLVDETVRRISGPGGSELRGQLAQTTPRDRKRWAVEEFHGAVSAGLTPDVEIRNLTRADEPLELETRIVRKARVETSGAQAFYDVDPWLAWYAYAMLSENTMHDYLMEGLLYRSRVRYRLCPETRVDHVGAELDFESQSGVLSRRYASGDATVDVSTTLDLRRRSLSTDDLRQFRRFVANALPETVIWFKYAAPDAP